MKYLIKSDMKLNNRKILFNLKKINIIFIKIK